MNPVSAAIKWADQNIGTDPAVAVLSHWACAYHARLNFEPSTWNGLHSQAYGKLDGICEGLELALGALGFDGAPAEMYEILNEEDYDAS